MKILHTSDWHLGKYLHEHSLLEDQAHVLDQIVGILEAGRHHALLITGDIYDRSVAAEEAVECFNSFLRKLKMVNEKCRILIIAGNHDSAKRLSYCADILPLGGVHIGWNPEKADVPVSIECDGEITDFYLMPFLDPHAYASHAEGEEPPEQSHQGAVEEAMQRIRLRIDTRRNNILLAHLFARGGSEGGSERNLIGTATLVEPDTIKGFNYAALGHLHRPQKVAENIHYSGSPVAYSFHETGYDKQVLDVTIKNGETTVTPVALSPLVSISRLNGEFKDFQDEDKYSEYLDHYLEIELTDGQPVPNAMAILRNRFKNILNLKQAPPAGSSAPTDINVDEDMNEGDHFKQFWELFHDSPPDPQTQGIFDKILKEING